MGPAAGKKCSPVFLAECCGFHAIIPEEETAPAPEALQVHFDSQGLSRAKAIALRKEEGKLIRAKERESEDVKEAGSARKSTPTTESDSRAAAAVILLDIEASKQKLAIRDRQIERLTWLINKAKNKSPPDLAGAAIWEQELEELYEAPLPSLNTATPSANSFRSSVTSSPFSPISLMSTFKAEATEAADASAHRPSSSAPLNFMSPQAVLPADFTSEVNLALDDMNMKFTDGGDEFFDMNDGGDASADDAVIAVPASTVGLGSVTPMHDRIGAPPSPPPVFAEQPPPPPPFVAEQPAASDVANVPPPPPRSPPGSFASDCFRAIVKPKFVPQPQAVKQKARAPLVQPITQSAVADDSLFDKAPGDSPGDCILTDFVGQEYKREGDESDKRALFFQVSHTRHTPHVTRHTSHVTRHTSHVTRHALIVTRLAETEAVCQIRLESISPSTHSKGRPLLFWQFCSRIQQAWHDLLPRSWSNLASILCESSAQFLRGRADSYARRYSRDVVFAIRRWTV